MGELEQAYGAISIGSMLSMGGYGITTLQVYMYFTTYFRDPIGIKALVWLVFSMDSLHSAFVCHANYFYLVERPAGFVTVWSVFASNNMTIIMSLIVKCFFLTRVYQICWPRWRWSITILISFLLVTSFLMGTISVIEFYVGHGSQLANLRIIERLSIPYVVTNLLGDIVITVVMTLCLTERRSEHQNTNSALNRIIMFSATRFMLITFFNGLQDVFIFMEFPRSIYAFGIDFVLCHVLANALLATLNSRIALKGRASEFSTSIASTTADAPIPISTRPPGTRTSRILSLVQGTAAHTDDEDGEQSGGSFVLHSSDFAASQTSVSKGSLQP